MADTQTITRELKIELLFNDTDTRIITLKDPKTTITTNDITSLEAVLLNGGTNTLVVSDKTGATLNKIKTVTKIGTTKTNLDISQ